MTIRSALSAVSSFLLCSGLHAGCAPSASSNEDELESQASVTPSPSQSEDDDHGEEESDNSECPGYVLQRRELKSLDETVHHQLSVSDFLAPVVKDRHFRFVHRPIPEFQVNPTLDGHQALLQIEYKGGEVIHEAWAKVEDSDSGSLDSAQGDTSDSAYAQIRCNNSLTIETETRLIVPELDIATRWESVASYRFDMNDVLDIAKLKIDVSTNHHDIAASLENKLIPTEPELFPGDSLDGLRWEQYILLKGSKLDTYMLDVVWYILLANPTTDIPNATIARTFSAGPVDEAPSSSGEDTWVPPG